MHVNGGFISPQGDDPPGPNIDLDKKMDVDKRCMGLNDYNSDMRKGGRGGGMNAYRPGVSKEVAPGDGGSYYDKVAPHRHSTVLCVSCLLRQFHFVFSHCSLFPPVVFPPLSSRFLLPPTTTQIGLPLAVAVTGLAFDQSRLVPWGGGSLLSVLTTHCLQAPFPLQPHYPL